jgi:hypothetical protein
MLPCQVLYADGLGLETAPQMYQTSSAIVRIYWVSTVTLRTYSQEQSHLDSVITSIQQQRCHRSWRCARPNLHAIAY